MFVLPFLKAFETSVVIFGDILNIFRDIHTLNKIYLSYSYSEYEYEYIFGIYS